MPSLSLSLAGCLLFYIGYKLISSTLVKRKLNAEASRRGCGPVPYMRSKYPFGLSTFIQSLKANKEERGPQYVVDSMNAIGKDVHTVQVRLIDYELVVTRDPENVRAALATQSQDFDIGHNRAQSFKPLLGVGIFTSRGEAWKHSRQLVRPQFSREQISDLDLAERHVQALSKRLTTSANGWTDPLDLQPLFYNFTLDTTTEFIYGHSVHSQDPSSRPVLPTVKGLGAPDRASLGAHLDAGKAWIETRGAFWKWYWLISSKDFDYHCKEVHTFVDWFVQLKLQQQHQPSTETPPLQKPKFILLDELAKQTRNPLELRNETLAVLTAGRDTTGALLGWVFYFLARQPRVYAKLRSIILAEFGPSASSAEITFAKLRGCQYLQYVINESFRVAAVIPLNERVCIKDTTLPRGGGPDGTQPVFIPKGRQVLLANYAMQHRADIWGNDVEEFRPERWEGRKVGWEFVPFGGGPRVCPGRKLALTFPFRYSTSSPFRLLSFANSRLRIEQFGLTETSYVVARLLQRFDGLENMEGPGRIRLHHAIENRSGSGVLVRLHEAKP